MQTPDAIERVAAECALDLAADGIVYAEVRYAPELSTQGGLSLDDVMRAWLSGFERGARDVGSRRAADHDPRDRHRDAPVRAIGGDRRAVHPLPRRWRRRLRHRRARGRLPAEPPSRCLPAHPPRELPRDDPRGRGVRPPVDLGSAPVVRRRAPRSRGADRRRPAHPARRDDRARSARPVRAGPTRAPRDVPDLERPHRCGRLDRRPPHRPAATAALPGDREHRQPADERRDPERRVRGGSRRPSASASTRCSGSRRTR